MSIGYMKDPEEVYTTDGDIAARSLAAVATLFTKTCLYPFEVYDFFVKITTAPTVTAPVIALKVTPLGGALSAAKATITPPVGAAVGSIWRNRVRDNALSFRLNIGDVLTCAVTTAATAGAGNVWVLLVFSQQLPPVQAAATYNEVTS